MLKNNKGFTLVELMVVLLIIAILIAVAIPVFLGARNRSYQNTAKQALTNASRAGASFRAASSASDWPTLVQMSSEESSYAFAAAAVASPMTIGYVPAADGSTAVWTVIAEDSAATTYTITGTATGALTRSDNW